MARDVFVKEGYQSPSIGLMETKRGTADATYLYYTLGKLQILKLREDLKKKEGAAFNLQQFHDEFLRQGPVPNKNHPPRPTPRRLPHPLEHSVSSFVIPQASAVAFCSIHHQSGAP